MLPAFQPTMACVTVPDLETGRRLAAVILQNRLAACVNIIPGLESHYWWEGKIDSAQELLLLIKTSAARLGELERCVKSNHPYQTPEFITFEIDSGSKEYLGWIAENVASTRLT